MDKEKLKELLIDMLTGLVEYEDGRNAEIAKGAVRRDMGRKVKIINVVMHILELFEKEKYISLPDVFEDPIFELLNCYEIDGSEIHDGMAHIDSGQAEALTKKIS